MKIIIVKEINKVTRLRTIARRSKLTQNLAREQGKGEGLDGNRLSDPNSGKVDAAKAGCRKNAKSLRHD